MSSEPSEAPVRRDVPVASAAGHGGPDEPAEPAGPADPAGRAGPADPAGLVDPAPLAGPTAATSASQSNRGYASPGPAEAAGAGYGTPGPPAGDRLPWKAATDGRTVFRRGTPFVVWWAWVVFAVFNVVQVAIPDHDYFSFELAAGLLAVTAIVYATALRPRVVTDEDGVSVQNPFRDHRIRWGALNAVYLGDSVEFSCARPAPRKDKTIYCWALYSARRSRMRARLRAERGRGGGLFAVSSRRPAISSRAPAEAQELAKQDPVQLMAAEIGRQTTEAKQRGAPAAVLESAWAWWPLAYLLVPAALLLGLVLAR